MQTTINERLNIIKDKLGLNYETYGNLIGVSSGNLRGYASRGTTPGAGFLEKVVRGVEKVKPLNLRWLLLGEGEPFEPAEQSSNWTSIVEELTEVKRDRQQLLDQVSALIETNTKLAEKIISLT
jgi:hypothetical protein